MRTILFKLFLISLIISSILTKFSNHFLFDLTDDNHSEAESTSSTPTPDKPVTCNAFHCSKDPLSGNTCSHSTAIGSNFDVSIKACPKGQYCPGFYVPQLIDTECESIPILKSIKFPGETCTEFDICTIDACINGKCPRGAIGDACDDHTKCAVGNYCSLSQKCAVQITSPTIKCNNDYECPNEMGCSIEKNCIKYFSVPIGGKVPADGPSYYITHMLCVSGFSEFFAGDYFCVNTKLQGSSWECAADQNTCTYDSLGGPQASTIYKYCVCSSSGSKYCPSDTTDSRFAGLIRNHINKVGHTLRRYSGNKKDPFNKYNYWPILEGADSCVEELFNIDN